MAIRVCLQGSGPCPGVTVPVLGGKGGSGAGDRGEEGTGELRNGARRGRTGSGGERRNRTAAKDIRSPALFERERNPRGRGKPPIPGWIRLPPPRTLPQHLCGKIHTVPDSFWGNGIGWGERWLSGKEEYPPSCSTSTYYIVANKIYMHPITCDTMIS